MIARAAALGTGLILIGLFASWGASGCSTTTCEEKATCPDLGAVGGDAAATSADSGAASGSSSGGGSGSNSGGSSGSGSGGTPICHSSEDCTNGIDDDCNSFIDCADPACGAYECTPVAPKGWSGPGILFQGSIDAGPADCPSTASLIALDGKGDPSTASATCGCTCGAPTNATCTTSVSFFYDSACANLCPTDPGSATCTTACAGAQTMTVNGTLTQAGTCTPHPTTTLPSSTWGTIGRLCGSPAPVDIPGGCASGMACVAKPPAAFNTTPCVWQSGDVACPTAGATRSVYYTGATDTRGCSACACDPPKGVTCGGASFTTYSDTACTSGPTVVSASGCASAPPGIHGVLQTTASTPAQGSCAADGGTSSGSLAPTGSTTVCCAAP